MSKHAADAEECARSRGKRAHGCPCRTDLASSVLKSELEEREGLAMRSGTALLLVQAGRRGQGKASGRR
jgi:hypothetical protein